MPTAVITESSEKTMSSSMICTITAPNDGATLAVTLALLAFELLVDLARALGEQEQAAADQDQVAARDARAPSTVNSGSVSRTIQASENSSRMRMTIAASSPTVRARSCCSARQLARQDRDEDHVVDAEHDLEDRERDQRDDGIGGEDPFHRSAPGLVGAGRRVDALRRQSQPGHRLAVHQMAIDNLVDIGGGDPAVPDAVRIDHHRRAVLALVETARLVGADAAVQAVFGQRLLEGLLQALVCRPGRTIPADDRPAAD